jgi:predicted oxidoreductase
VLDSLQHLNISTLDALLLHRPADLQAVGDEIMEAVDELRRNNKIRKFGISIYDPSELELYLGKYPIDIVQCPPQYF